MKKTLKLYTDLVCSEKWKWISSVVWIEFALCDPMDCSLRGSSIHGIFQVRVLEWVAMSFSRGSPQLRDRTRVSSIASSWFYCLSHQVFSNLNFMFSRTTFQGIVGLTLTILRGRGKGHQCTLDQILVIWKKTEEYCEWFSTSGSLDDSHLGNGETWCYLLSVMIMNCGSGIICYLILGKINWRDKMI